MRLAGWECIIAGPGDEDYLNQLQTLCRVENVQDSVRFLPATEGDDKWRLDDSADPFILPSHSENFGLVIVEALTAAVPVITTQSTPWCELVEHDCGWWVADEFNAVLQALSDATKMDASQLRQKGERGRRLIESKYTWDGVGKAMAMVYEWLLRGGDAPDSVSL